MVVLISAKCSDMFFAELDDGRVHEGYVPDLFCGDMGEDYITLRIDMDTGKIVGWEKPSEDDLEKVFGKKP